MTYKELLDRISKREKIPQTIYYMGMAFKIAFNKHNELIDYYWNGTSLSDRISCHMLQDQPDIEFDTSNDMINIWETCERVSG